MYRLALLAALILAAPAQAAPSCQKAAEAYGSMMRASIFCNFSKRPAVDKSADAMRGACPSPEAARPGIAQGFTVFERDLAKLGKDQACSEWFEFIGRLSL